MLDALFGNYSELKPDDSRLKEILKDVIVSEEAIMKAFIVMRDMFIFTNKRMIVVDKQGFTGNKVEYHSYPYKSIVHFAVETAGSFDRDSELKIWLSGGHVFQREFKKGSNITDIQKIIAQAVLK